MAHPLELEELVEHFTLYPGETRLLRNKTGATRLGFGLSLKFLLWKARFPRGRGELPDNMIEFVAGQVACPPPISASRALELIKRYKAETTHNTQYYARGEQVPFDGVVPPDLRELLYKTDKRGRPRILRSVYECGVFQTLREKLRCTEIWVTGAGRWRQHW